MADPSIRIVDKSVKDGCPEKILTITELIPASNWRIDDTYISLSVADQWSGWEFFRFHLPADIPMARRHADEQG
ncbi:MAG: hypothetical protein Kow0022_00810 [Phycisphaerales bacterium]